MSATPTQVHVARVARAVKANDPAAEIEARSALAEAKITDYVQRVLASAPPLSDEQRTRLAQLLAPALVQGGGDA